mgnify:CR=1 FL=1|jgi:aminoglycoside 6'-N-acetyltransferase I
MKIELKLTDAKDAHIIKNLWPLYQHETSVFGGCKPNAHGIFGVDDSVKDLGQHGPGPWWTDPKALFPYLILVDGAPAGFNLVGAQPRLWEGSKGDLCIEEFFVLHAYRAKGVAEQAARLGFDAHRGRWEVFTWPNNPQAIAFWRRVIGTYSSMKHVEGEIDYPSGKRISFHFDS